MNTHKTPNNMNLSFWLGNFYLNFIWTKHLKQKEEKKLKLIGSTRTYPNNFPKFCSKCDLDWILFDWINKVFDRQRDKEGKNIIETAVDLNKYKKVLEITTTTTTTTKKKRKRTKTTCIISIKNSSICAMQLLWLCLFGLICGTDTVFSSPRSDIFTSSFLVRFRRNVDNYEAHQLATRNGFENLGPVSVLFVNQL